MPRITYFTCSAMISSLPTPFCTEQTALFVVEDVRDLRDRTAGVNRLGGDDAVVAARQFALASLVAFSRAVKSAAPERRSPFFWMASVCSFQTS